MERRRLILPTVTYAQLISYGVHIGRAYANSLLFHCAWMALGVRENIMLIDLNRLLSMLRFAFNALDWASWSYSPIWFINMNPVFEGVIQGAARSCGHFHVGKK